MKFFKTGADISIKRALGNTALHIAGSSNDVETVELLLDRNVNLNELNQQQSSVAHSAAEHNSVDVLRTLIER